MDDILARAGVHGAAQQQLCVDAVRSEAQQTQRQLDAALSALQRLLRVAQLASDAGERSSLAQLAPDVAQVVDQMQSRARNINTQIQELRAVVHTSSVPESQERRELRTQVRRELRTQVREERPQAVATGGSRAQIGQERSGKRPQATAPRGTLSWIKSWSSESTSFLRPFTSSSESESSEEESRRSEEESRRSEEESESFEEVRDFKRQVVEIHGRRIMVSREPPYQSGNTPLERLTARLNKLPPGKTSLLIKMALETAIEIAQLEDVSGDEQCIPRCVNATRTALRFFLKQHKSFPDGGLDHFEDIRQTLLTLVRAIQHTNGKLEAAGMRDLLSLVKELQQNSIAPATRTSLCRSNLQKFITKHYVKPAEESAADQQKLVATLDEVRAWKTRNDFSVARIGAIMGVVRALFEGKYEDWNPKKDQRVALLTQLVNHHAATFPQSHTQACRLDQFREWHRSMPSASFVPTLDLMLSPPLNPSAMTMDPSRADFGPQDIEAGLKFVGHMMRSKNLEVQAFGICRFMVFVTSTSQPRMSVDELRCLSKHIRNLEVLPCEEISLDTAQTLEKILYMMRIVMRKQPECEELSTSCIDIILSLFPSSSKPTFIYPSKIPPSETPNK